MASDRSKSVVVTFNSDLGWFGLIGTRQGVTHLTFGHGTGKEVHEALKLEVDATELISRPPWAANVQKLLVQYASGEPVDLSHIPLDRGPLTAFQEAVFHRVCGLGYGETMTYGELAAEVGHPRAARAVGTCMATNPIPLLVPCHRVLAANGKLGGYSATRGTSMKQDLLDLERAGSHQFLTAASR